MIDVNKLNKIVNWSKGVKFLTISKIEKKFKTSYIESIKYFNILINNGYFYQNEDGRVENALIDPKKVNLKLGVSFDGIDFYSDFNTNGNLLVLSNSHNNDIIFSIKRNNSNNLSNRFEFLDISSINDVEKIFQNSLDDKNRKKNEQPFKVICIPQSTFNKFSLLNKEKFKKYLKDSLVNNIRFIFVANNIDLVLEDEELISLFSQIMTVGLFDKWVYSQFFGVNYEDETITDDNCGMILTKDSIIKLSFNGLRKERKSKKISLINQDKYSFVQKCRIFSLHDKEINTIGYLFEKDKFLDKENSKEKSKNIISLAEKIYESLCDRASINNFDETKNTIYVGSEPFAKVNEKIFKQIIMNDIVGFCDDVYDMQILENFAEKYIFEFNRSLELSDDRLRQITLIQIKNLRGSTSFEFKLKNEDKINFLFGENGIGKTTTFSILDMLINLDNRNAYKNLKAISQIGFSSFIVYFKNDYYIRIDLNRNDEQSTEMIIGFVFYDKLEGGFSDSEKIIFSCSEDCAKDQQTKCSKIVELKKMMFCNLKSPIKYVKVNRLFSAIDFVEFLKLNKARVVSLSFLNKVHDFNKNIEALYNNFSKEYLVSEIKNNVSKANDEIRKFNSKKNESHRNKIILELSKENFSKLGEAYELGYLKEPLNNDNFVFCSDCRSYSITNNSKEANIIIKKIISDFEKYKLFKETFEKFYDENDDLFKEIIINDGEPQFLLKNSKTKYILGINQLSPGELNLVNLIFNVAYEGDNGKIILIDEPEISLHLAWQQSLYEALRKIVERRNTQIIIASHSPFVCGGHDELLIAPTYLKGDQKNGTEN